MAVGVDDVEETDDVGVVHFFEEGDFADGGGGDAFVFGFEADFLQGDDALVWGGEVAGFVDYAVGACVEREDVRRVDGSGSIGSDLPSPTFSNFW